MFPVPTFVVPFLFPPAVEVLTVHPPLNFSRKRCRFFCQAEGLGGRLPRHFNEGSFWGWGPLIWNLTSSTPEKNLKLSCYSYIHVHLTFRFMFHSIFTLLAGLKSWLVHHKKHTNLVDSALLKSWNSLRNHFSGLIGGAKSHSLKTLVVH